MRIGVVGKRDVRHLGEQVMGRAGEQLLLDPGLPSESAGAGGGDEGVADDLGQRVLGIGSDDSGDRETAGTW